MVCIILNLMYMEDKNEFNVLGKQKPLILSMFVSVLVFTL